MAGGSSEPSARPLGGSYLAATRGPIVRSVGSTIAWVAGIVTAYYIVPWNGGGATTVAFRIVLALALLIVVSVTAVPSVLKDPYPVLRAFRALAVVVALAIVSFASIYLLVSSNDSAAFTELLGSTDALYFSVTTTTTVGYGDISAKSEVARIVVMIQMVANVVVVGVTARVLFHAARQRTDIG